MMTYKPSKVGQGDLFFVARPGFISRSVCARLQVCVQRLRFVPPWLASRHTDTRTQADRILTSFIWLTVPAELKKYKKTWSVLTWSWTVCVRLLWNAVLCCCCSFEKKIYQRWVAGVDEACSFNLAQPLIVRNEETNFIAVNFDPQVIAVSHWHDTFTNVNLLLY